MPIRLKAAQTAAERNEVYKLRYQVFVEEENRFDHSSDRIFDFYDTLSENVNFVAMVADRVVGSMRVTIDNPLGMPALEHYDFSHLMKKKSGKFAGIGWLCIAKDYRRHRGMLTALFKMMIRETKNRGVQHVIAPLHPNILPLLKRFGANPVDKEFFSEKLNVPIVPIHIDYNDLPPGLREFSQDPFHILFQDSNERRIYRKGENIIEEGNPGNEAFLIMRGSVEVLAHSKNGGGLVSGGLANKASGKGNPLLGQGRVFGELALLDGSVRTATVVCHSKEVDVMVWTRAQVLRQLNKDNQIAIRLCEILANRLRVQVEGCHKEQAYNSLLASAIVDTSREACESVDLTWLSTQCGLNLTETQALIDQWVKEGIIRYDDCKTLRVCELDLLKKNIKWK
ncbi:MAG: GNAT family N-acetyltransferase [Desulfatitalea sp.]|nr:GNAT family N-acetyltransferase [Desulfatitalea sp.]NNK01761.1 GNAT family N-acetyltransferase [Desulfatitalea sp.]